MKAKRTCTVDGCCRKHKANGLCQRHYDQVRIYGKILIRTKFDPNEFIIDGDICKIQMYDKNNNPTCQTIIDAEDYEKVKNIKWSHNAVLNRVFNDKVGYLSRFILSIADPKILVDHANRDKLDNRKENLRTCGHAENNWNQTLTERNNSGYKGIFWNEQRLKWRATVRFLYHSVVREFEEIEDAVEWVKQKRKELHGEFARDQ
jgi:hypothetical protein